MPSTNPRLSSVAHNLLRESLELREDIALSKIADKRAEGFDRGTAPTADQVFD